MIPLPLTAAQLTTLHQVYSTTHSRRITVQVQDMNGRRLSDVSDTLLSGQVNIDNTAGITRSCTMSLLDPNNALHFDSNAPTDGALFLDRQISVVYSVKAPRSTTWYDVPLFVGPVSKLDRSGPVINLEAQGKESIAQHAAWKIHTYKKGAYRVDVIRAILQDLTGETKFTFPEHSARLPADVSVGRTSVPWAVARKIAKSMNMQLFYDGRGVCRLRPTTTMASYTFKSGDDGAVLNRPQASYSVDQGLKNIVWIRGAGTISVSLAAPNSHPLSPVSLARNGVPRYLLYAPAPNPSIRTKTEALALANQSLADLLLESIQVTFDSMVIPTLDPGDIVRVTTGDFSNSFRLHQFSIPLVGQAVMSVGYLANRSPNKKAILS